MGIQQITETIRRKEIEDLQWLLNLNTHVYTKFKSNDIVVTEKAEKFKEKREEEKEEEEEEKLVCVTSGVSFLGIAIVNRLLSSGYSVRILIDNQEDLEKLGEILERFGGGDDGGGGGNRVKVVVAKVTEAESLWEAFEGCYGVFHTSAFADPAGVSGYSKSMADLEVKASQNVMEVCSRTDSIRKCVFTSSLLACVWGNHDYHSEIPTVLDHNRWSDESICIDKKLWLALGKTMAEKAAWSVANDNDVKLATICPGFITGPEFYNQNPSPSLAYLKGGQEMYEKGVLATIDVNKLAEAHICVYEGMNKIGYGRYLCFDQVIERDEEVLGLATKMGIPADRIINNTPQIRNFTPRFRLCNQKLSRLMSRRSRCYQNPKP